MSDWDVYQMDCDFTNEKPTVFGFIKTELQLFWSKWFE